MHYFGSMTLGPRPLGEFALPAKQKRSPTSKTLTSPNLFEFPQKHLRRRIPTNKRQPEISTADPGSNIRRLAWRGT